MNSVSSNPAVRRVAVMLALAAAVAGLMLGAAWFKRSVPAGSLAEDLWETAILALAVVSLFIPLLALRLPSANAHDMRNS